MAVAQNWLRKVNLLAKWSQSSRRVNKMDREKPKKKLEGKKLAPQETIYSKMAPACPLDRARLVINSLPF